MKAEMNTNQFIRCNTVVTITMIILSLLLTFAMIIEATETKQYNNLAIQLAVILIPLLIDIAVMSKYKSKELTMRVISVMWVITYTAITYISDTSMFAFTFPVMMVLMVYINIRLTLIGAISAFVINLIHIMVELTSKDVISNAVKVEYSIQLIILILAGVATTIGTRLLLKFMEESRIEILEKVMQQQKTADEVTVVAENITESFELINGQLSIINQQVENNNLSMEHIAASTENTAGATQLQMNMTRDIQEYIIKADCNAQNVMMTTNDIIHVVSNAIELVGELKDQSNMVNVSTNNTATALNNLSKRVMEMSNITNAILNISKQTNLLALNASIEAARAGEAGRGFSVVAEQIRTLSEQTKISTEQITDIINDVKTVSDDTIQSLDNSMESIHKQSEMVISVNDSFLLTGKEMDKLKEFVNDIFNDMQKVIKSNQEIVVSISGLSNSSEEVASTTNASLETSSLILEKVNTFSKSVKDMSILVERLREVVR